MSSGNTKRTRSDRVATLKLPPGTIQTAWQTVRRGDVLARVGLCLLTAVAVWTITGGWVPPFAFRIGDVPPRNVIARVDFQRVDPQATLQAQNAARSIIDCVYKHDPRPLDELQQALKDRIFQLRSAATYEELDKQLWSEFSLVKNAEPALEVVDQLTTAVDQLTGQGVVPPVAPGELNSAQLKKIAEFERFRKTFNDDSELVEFAAAIKRSFAAFEEHGLLESLQHQLGEGNNSRIRVYPVGNPTFLQTFQAAQVRIGQAAGRLEANLKQQLPTEELANQVLAWLRPNLPVTLTYDAELTRRLADEQIASMRPEMVEYKANETVLARAASALTAPLDLEILREEHQTYVEQLGPLRLLYFSLSKFGMYLALYTLCGFYIFFRRRPLLTDIVSLAKLLLVVFATIGVAWFVAPARFELIPLLIFSMTVVILYHQELALLLSAAVALVVVLSLGYSLVHLVTVFASMSSAVLLLRHIRSRTKLIYVALWIAAATMATAVGVGNLSGQTPVSVLFQNALWMGGCAVAAGLLMTHLLPFIERFFDVQTDLSLLELGDVAHPLLQELVRRAPGTYNHSINVASIAQAGAESIGANGLLVRVGAYFHDIGKMLKPGYFIENQAGQDNRHESLVPAMSTLVIIAHVKDGADLARQHNLPNSIIDFILQHHGTTLVEYFYRRANEQQKETDPEAAQVDEGTYRYPGPKPQTREAAVLMMADAVESAARTLVDPAPARIENLVEEISMKRLMDGQFDECGITLRDLRTVQDSLIKSLTAVYHGRIKYPAEKQQSA